MEEVITIEQTGEYEGENPSTMQDACTVKEILEDAAEEL